MIKADLSAHLKHFASLNRAPGPTINNTSSVTYLRRHALGARLDEGLFRVMQSGEGSYLL